MDILSAPTNVAMLIIKVLKTSDIFEIIFFRSGSLEINPFFKSELLNDNYP